MKHEEALHETNTFPPRGIIRVKEMKSEYGLPRVTVWRLEKEDTDFPPRIPISGKSFGYFRHELDFYFTQKREREVEQR